MKSVHAKLYNDTLDSAVKSSYKKICVVIWNEVSNRIHNTLLVQLLYRQVMNNSKFQLRSCDIKVRSDLTIYL